ncbi:pilus assembly FimT family protein [Massilia sp. S19_KUP03_FR1]|uniref:pilus assembly FimT family protein n=1 Tax=Massilia sp. S19_KUP03_FR1 TaxID=3025503 RepID=UPI002FCD7ED9
MHPVSAQRQAGLGFTLVELMVGLAILSLMLAIGVPSMRTWLNASNALVAAEFYAEGLKTARAEAVKRNATARLTLLESASGGQMDWRIDMCVPTSAVKCNADEGSWSTKDAAADGDSVADFRSITRVATNLPGTNMLTMTRNDGAVAVYFTPLGWVDGSVAPSLSKIELAPAASQAGAFPTSAVAVTLAGVVSKCNPNAPAHDSRGCPP